MSCSINVSGEEDRRWEYFFDGDHKCQIKSIIQIKRQNGRQTTTNMVVPKGLTVVAITPPDPLLQACSHSEEAEAEKDDQHRFNFKVY